MPLACRLFAFGEKPPAVRVEEIPTPAPAPGEVVVRMLAAPINPADLNVIEGTYGELPPLPATIGNEGCGEILALGAGVEDLRVGQKVLPLAFGTWARELILPAKNAIPLPDDINIHQAAMLTVNPATAWRLLHDFSALQPGDWIAQNAANSGVGRAVIQLARHLGLRTLNVVRRPELLGAMARQPLKIPNGLLIFQNLAFRGFWLRRWKETAPAAEIQSTYATLADLLHRGILHTPVDRVFPLSELPAALAAASQDKRPGKILLDLQG